MAVTYSIEPGERIVYLTVTGESSLAEWEAAMSAALADPAYQKGFNFLSDRRAQTNVPDTGFTKGAIAFFQAHSSEFDGCRLAAVSDRDAVYGMSRMFAMLSEGTCVRVEAFRDYEDARRWLRESSRG
jgi:hypothetical protein